MKKNFITARFTKFQGKTDVYVELNGDGENTISLSIAKWDEVQEQMEKHPVSNIEIAKAYQDRTDATKSRDAKLLKWNQKREDKLVEFELYTMSEDEKAKFQFEVIVTNEQLDEFAPILKYYKCILEEIREGIEAEKLAKTNLLTRE